MSVVVTTAKLLVSPGKAGCHSCHSDVHSRGLAFVFFPPSFILSSTWHCCGLFQMAVACENSSRCRGSMCERSSRTQFEAADVSHCEGSYSMATNHLTALFVPFFSLSPLSCLFPRLGANSQNRDLTIWSHLKHPISRSNLTVLSNFKQKK